MAKRFFQLAAIVAPLHIVATLAFNFLALETIFVDVRHLAYRERVYDFLADECRRTGLFPRQRKWESVGSAGIHRQTSYNAAA